MTFALPHLLAPPRLPAPLAELVSGTPVPPDLAAAMLAAWTYAPYLRDIMEQRPDLLRLICRDGEDAAIARAMAGIEQTQIPVGQALRAAKKDIALIVALADLARRWPLEKVSTALSDFADLALDRALAHIIAERTPDQSPRGFAILALGKHGSRELNYSSDIDLIFLHDRDQLPRRPREDPDDAAVRIAQRLSKLMQDHDEHGYVFRVDLRLRPAPEATALCLPVEAAEHYYHSLALAWERLVFIRARAAAGDKRIGNGFLDAIAPFVWRRTLDYNVIPDVQDISVRIRDHYARGQEAGPGYNLKQGRGGIRQIEFFAQLHQAIFGGRDPALRCPATLDALAALSAAERIDPQAAHDMAEAYRFHREVEHRVQMRRDEQSHSLPQDAGDGGNLAAFCGYEGWDGLLDATRKMAAQVSRHYDKLNADPQDSTGLPVRQDALQAHLAQAGFQDAKSAGRTIGIWRSAHYRALRTQRARRALEHMLPDFITSLGATDAPDTALARADDLFSRMPSGVQFFSLLAAQPHLTHLLGRLLGVTSTLADSLANRPELLDAIFDNRAFERPDPQTMRAELQTTLADVEMEEDLLDQVRRWTAEQRFRIGVQLIEGLIDPLDAATIYADLADAGIDALTPPTIARFAQKYGRPAQNDLLILALGRQGGRALTPQSDLDLIYLFSGENDTPVDGPRTMSAVAWFNKLAQRLSAIYSAPTAAGPLYEIDTRLRPSGTQGLIAVSLDAFLDYQTHHAWTWEHMALLRARIVYGPAPARAHLDQIIAQVLHMKRDPERLRADILSMREEMESAKPPKSAWDVKLARGGLVDLEFMLHFLQLRDHQGITPDLRLACRTLRPDLEQAHDLMMRTLVMLRLLCKKDKLAPASSASAVLAQSCGTDDLVDLQDRLHGARAQVARAWEDVFGCARPVKA